MRLVRQERTRASYVRRHTFGTDGPSQKDKLAKSSAVSTSRKVSLLRGSIAVTLASDRVFAPAFPAKLRNSLNAVAGKAAGLPNFPLLYRVNTVSLPRASLARCAGSTSGMSASAKTTREQDCAASTPAAIEVPMPSSALGLMTSRHPALRAAEECGPRTRYLLEKPASSAALAAQVHKGLSR